jgi:hypothetical protein
VRAAFVVTVALTTVGSLGCEASEDRAAADATSGGCVVVDAAPFGPCSPDPGPGCEYAPCNPPSPFDAGGGDAKGDVGDAGGGVDAKGDVGDASGDVDAARD